MKNQRPEIMGGQGRNGGQVAEDGETLVFGILCLAFIFIIAAVVCWLT